MAENILCDKTRNDLLARLDVLKSIVREKETLLQQQRTKEEKLLTILEGKQQEQEIIRKKIKTGNSYRINIQGESLELQNKKTRSKKYIWLKCKLREWETTQNTFSTEEYIQAIKEFKELWRNYSAYERKKELLKYTDY